MAINNGQTCLEKRGIDERHTEMVRSDYNMENQYSATHKDAISDGDNRGKGTNHGGHSHFLPDCSLDTHTINYQNFDTVNGGDCYDINGRNGIGGRKRAMAMSLYNTENQYGSNSVNTEQNINDGQYYVGQQIGLKDGVCG